MVFSLLLFIKEYVCFFHHVVINFCLPNRKKRYKQVHWHHGNENIVSKCLLCKARCPGERLRWNRLLSDLFRPSLELCRVNNDRPQKKLWRTETSKYPWVASVSTIFCGNYRAGSRAAKLWRSQVQLTGFPRALNLLLFLLKKKVQKRLDIRYKICKSKIRK